MKATKLVIITLISLWMSASVALAQVDPESGDTGDWEPPTADATEKAALEEKAELEAKAKAEADAKKKALEEEEPPTAALDDKTEKSATRWFQEEKKEEAIETTSKKTDTNHADLVGKYSFTYFGVDSLRLTKAGNAYIDGDLDIHMPTIGTRYWFDEKMGLDLGIGFGFINHEENVAGVVVGGTKGAMAFRLHVGMPYVLKDTKYITFLVLPEVDFGYGMGTALASTVPAGTTRAIEDYDASLSTLQIDANVRFGGEIHFGFWNMPNVAIQASVGLGVRYSKAAASNDLDGEAGNVDLSETNFNVTTFADDLFTGNIRVTYYF